MKNFFFLIFSLLIICSPSCTSSSESKEDKTDTTTSSEENTNAASNDYSIKQNSFMGISPGDKIEKHSAILTAGKLSTGEGQFDIFDIKNGLGQKLGYVMPDPNDATVIRDIIISSPLAETTSGVKVGSPYSMLEEKLGDFEVHGSEIESKTYANQGKTFFLLNVPNNTYEVDKSTIDKNARVVQIELRG